MWEDHPLETLLILNVFGRTAYYLDHCTVVEVKPDLPKRSFLTCSLHPFFDEKIIVAACKRPFVKAIWHFT